MNYLNKVIDTKKAKQAGDLERLLKPLCSQGYDVKGVSGDFIILTKAVAS